MREGIKEEETGVSMTNLKGARGPSRLTQSDPIDLDDDDEEFIDMSPEDSPLYSEVESVVHELSASFQNLSTSLKRPNILLVGKTGSGKSSLVNAVFGSKFAATGTGEPITRHLEKYSPEGKSVNVYDTKGLEHGNHIDFIRETEGFLRSLKEADDLREQLHVVWYVIDMSHARFQPFEITICRTLLSRTPLCFVLNKEDTATSEQVRSVSRVVAEQKFENCKGIFGVVSDRKNYSPEFCPHCKGTNFRFRQRTKEVLCDEPDCGQRSVISSTSGLEDLVKETIKQLPDLAILSFIQAQQVTEKERLLVAKKAIIDCAFVARRKRYILSQPTRLILNMASKLALLWGYRLIPSIVTQEIAHQYFVTKNQAQNFLRRFARLISELISRRRLSQALAVMIGVEICRLFLEIKMKAVGFALNPTENFPDHLESFFSLNVSDELLEEIATEIKKSSLDVVVTSHLLRRVSGFISAAG